MKLVLGALALTALLGTVPVQAQTEMDHRVQRAWDDVVHPTPPGDPRTNWERHRDDAHYRQTQAAQRAGWCRNHPRTESCARYDGR